ncbi:MAG: helix-turn-helix transcriptional regulator [Clostridia bacterium]|nr:helix-turn-helix transcriptional regulator [Clostridia bacterium]
MEDRQPSAGEKRRFPDGFRILQGKQEYITYVEHASIRIWPSDVASHYDAHMHSAIEIILPHRGTSVYYLQDEIYQVKPGEILIIPSGVVHSLTESQDTQRYLLLFEPNPLTALRDMSQISEMMKRPIYLHDRPELQAQVSELLMQVVNCYFKCLPMWNTQCYSYLLQMYALLGQQYADAAAPQRTLPQWRIDPEIMNSAITFINEHYMDDISLEDVAAFVGFSKFYFSRTFKQFSGLSFSEFLSKKRLNVASDLLVRTPKTIREIAEEAGFGSIATFNRLFREEKNCTPTQFRSIYGLLFSADPDSPLLPGRQKG